MTGLEYSFLRYLAAKKSVDDRALNQQVWDALSASLPEASPRIPLRVLEIGAGIGTMLERMIERNLLEYAEYTAVDVQEKCINYGRRRIPIWAQDKGLIVKDSQAGGIIEQENLQVKYQLEAFDLIDFITQSDGKRTWDLIIAHAFLDLVDVPRVLPMMLKLCADGGLLYFSLNYDGLTIFEPAIQDGFEQHILAMYDETMDQRWVEGNPSGDSQTGRHLFNYLSDVGAQIIAAGSSDWVVHPHSNGYIEDEAYFLHYIIHTIDGELDDHPKIDQERFRAWIAKRHAQVDRQELVYISHQIDFLGKKVKQGQGIDSE
jgi:SAM-dependent methyltransferase